MTRILVIILRYIGDVLLATPVLRALRDAYPAAHLSIAVLRGTEPVVQDHPDLNDLVVVERGGLRRQLALAHALRARAFDCVLDLTDADRSALLSAMTGAPVRLGFNWEHRWRGLLYTRVVAHREGIHRVERNLDAVRALGLDPKPARVIFEVTHAARLEADTVLGALGVPPREGRMAMLHPGARQWFKAWPAERFAEVAGWLMEEGWRVLIGGGDMDASVAEDIVRRTNGRAVSLAGLVGLQAFGAILERCALFVGNDNGAMHMAAAHNVPVVGLFGPTAPSEWGPFGGRAETIYKGVDCRICFHPTCRRGEQNCMRLISVDEVRNRIRRLLSGSA